MFCRADPVAYPLLKWQRSKMSLLVKTTSAKPEHYSWALPARKWLLVASSSLVYLAALARAKGESRADYRYDFYSEDAGRIQVETHGLYFDAAVNAALSLKGNVLVDSISGATPDGSPPLPGQHSVATSEMHDRRYAGFIEPTVKFSNHTLSPQIAYSEESDYRSIGVALNDAMDFNEKNTTVLVGLSHAFDHILPNEGERFTSGKNIDAPITTALQKDDSEVLLGLTQLLDADTVATANVTLGYSDGFLTDPYKRVVFDNFPFFGSVYTTFPEKRPGYKFRQIIFLSLQHHFEKIKGALEVTYRFQHDSYGILANTASLQWHQKIGKRVIVSPLLRFHTQTAADFYATHFAGDPTDPGSTIPLPDYYSSDYRLSALNTFTYGVQVSAKIAKHVSLDLAYKRYEMFGNDGVTASAQYPKAHIFTGGLTVWF